MDLLLVQVASIIMLSIFLEIYPPVVGMYLFGVEMVLLMEFIVMVMGVR